MGGQLSCSVPVYFSFSTELLSSFIPRHSMRPTQQLPTLLAVLVLMAAITASGATPQQSPKKTAKADVYKTPHSYIAAYHYLQCTADSMPVPTSTKEVAAIVGQYYAKAQAGQPVTLRVSRPKFHSTATFVCPVAPTTLRSAAVAQERAPWPRAEKAPLEVAILQSKLNKVLAVDKQQYTMRVGAGMRLTELLPAATKAGMSAQIGSLPAYQGLTLGGILSTSAHGSGDRTTSSLADALLEVTWVDGRGRVHVSRPKDPEFKALYGGVGVLGVVTELLLQMTPPTNTQLITVVKKDKNMMDEINRLLKISPHILIHWRPDAGIFKAFLIKQAPKGARATPGVDMTVLPPIDDQATMAAITDMWHTTQGDDSEMSDFLCPQLSDGSLQATWASVKRKRVANVTAPTNHMAASECDDHCLWNDRRVFNGTAQDAEFTIEFAQLRDWIADVKRAFDVELKENGKASYRCMGLGYMWIRFGQGYDGLTATTSGLKRPVYVQSTWMRSRVGPLYQMRYQFVLDLIEELTLCKYKGRPHWGKNFDRTFTHPRCPVTKLYPRFNQLLALAKRYDPAGMFKTRLFDVMVKQGKFELTPQCK
eukprot:GHRQ01002140.1.p1 GENE.GHRQ01002140.1~~GHRQ01002140.1.p1  ORF type:complete len:593 (+),score=177.48 GHRQ01002140.1:42-1820(+)